MEALAAISLVGTIIQFVDVAGKILSTAKEIQDSSSGITGQRQSLQESAQYVQQLSTSMRSSSIGKSNADQQELHRLAQVCCEVSDQILDLVQSMSPTRRTPKFGTNRGTIFTAIRIFTKEKPLKELEQKLYKCRTELQLQYSQISSNETQTRLSMLAQDTMRGNERLFDLQKRVADLQCGASVTSLSPSAQQQIQALLSMSQNARDQIIQLHIRKSLEFPGMNERSEVIEQAHRDTYSWLLQDEEPTGIGSVKADARRKYTDWLLSGSGIFHIAGKPGSGKSTLMKLLSDHPSTRDKLLTWAGKHKLILVRFFFWKPASSRLPRSIAGLQRSIIHGVLKECPELTSIVFPDKWSELVCTESPQAYDCSVSDVAIGIGFENLLGARSLAERYRLCFFIDALDELHETPQQRHDDLLDLLDSWIAIASKSLKICVSSREDNVFIDSLKSAQRIRLQDLTRDDMLCYCLDRLRRLKEKHERNFMAEHIVTRSEGIFLWVALVTSDVCQVHADGGNFTALKEELDSVPKELNALYKHLLAQVSGPRLRTAYLMFAMVMKFETYRSNMSLFASLYMQTFAENPQFAFEELATNDMPTSPDNDECYMSRLDAESFAEARRFVQGLCKGLVEIRSLEKSGSRPLPSPMHYHYVIFVHRSVIEFLSRSETIAIMPVQLVDVDVVEVISQTHLAVFKCLPACLLDCITWAGVFEDILQMRAKFNVDRVPFAYLEHLESVLPSKVSGCFTTPPLSEEFLDYYLKKFNGDPHSSVCVGIRRGSGSISTQPRIVMRPLHLCAQFGVVNYVQWKLSHAPEFLADPLTTTLLAWCLCECSLPGPKPKDVTSLLSCFSNILSSGILESNLAYAYTFMLDHMLPMTRSKRPESREIAYGCTVLLLKHIIEYNSNSLQAGKHSSARQLNSNCFESAHRPGNSSETAFPLNPWLDDALLRLYDQPESPKVSVRKFMMIERGQHGLPVLNFIDDMVKSRITTADRWTDQTEDSALVEKLLAYHEACRQRPLSPGRHIDETSGIERKSTSASKTHDKDSGVLSKVPFDSGESRSHKWDRYVHWYIVTAGGVLGILFAILVAQVSGGSKTHL